MPKWEIEQYELHVQTYRVEAATEAEAIKRLFDGEAEAVDGGLVFIEVANDFGLPRDEYQDLADELEKLDAWVDDDVIPSVRSIQKCEVAADGVAEVPAS
jgi:hypothetical protein